MVKTSQYYFDISTFYAKHFEGKVQKLSLEGGFTCPNRDGKISRGGCSYCNNRTFNPDYCSQEGSIQKQLEVGKSFFSRKYPQMKYLAYFQAYSNTYAEVNVLRQRYEEALTVPDVVGIIIGTRPDCLDDAILDYLEELSTHTFVLVELGIESIKNTTLERINRGHSYEIGKLAIEKLVQRNIMVGIHMILGLPGENYNDFIDQAREVSQLPITTLKLHQLQIIKDTPMANEYKLHTDHFHLFDVNEYIELVAEYISMLPTNLVLDRFISQSPNDLLIAPRWGLKNYQFNNLLINYLKKNHLCQGKNWH